MRTKMKNVSRIRKIKNSSNLLETKAVKMA